MLTCTLCGAEAHRFQPLPRHYGDELAASGCPYPLDGFETLNLHDYACPACNASDRERLMALYFLRHWVEEGRAGQARVLEIAPSAALSSLLREFAGEYRSADLYSAAAMDVVDITDMRAYDDARFDLVVCSHVLEHVRDDAAALRELHRVLSVGGTAVLLVPLPLSLAATDELAPGEPLPADAERVRRFGQNDHVRMYARGDFMRRISAAGFAVQVMGPEGFPDDRLDDFGILARSRLYLAHKSAA